MKIFTFVFLLSLSFCLPFGSQIGAEDRIEWYHSDLAPGSIVEGPDSGTGYLDRVEQFVAKRLEGYTHTFVVANYFRIIETLKENDRICCAALYKTPDREKFIEYSIPTYIILPNGLILPRNRMARYQRYVNKEREIDLERLLREVQPKIGVVKGRNLGRSIEGIIEKYRGTESIYERPRKDLNGLMMMMISGRIDGVIGFPLGMEYARKQLGFSKEEVVFFAINGIQAYDVGYIGCSKTAWGREVIGKINDIIKIPRTNDFLDFYESWLDETTAKRHRKLAQEYFRTH